ncbi:MAG TPA: DUF5989 family protein [Actinomycetota bacterium]|nr:DUF5989 family protein [Actinomycetota bacterium]
MVEDKKTTDFEEAASGRRRGVASEVSSFVWRNKRWWMIPMLLVLFLLGLVILLGSTGAGAFIYPLF